MKMSNETYDILKWVALTVIPALNILMITLSELWNIPYGTLIAGTISAIGIFIARCLKLSSDVYYSDSEDGDM